MFDFGIITNWVHTQLTSLMPEALAIFLECVIIGICLDIESCTYGFDLRTAGHDHKRKLLVLSDIEIRLSLQLHMSVLVIVC